ncbi:hypothetical protein K469DRAFT_727421 [Zopfia rhizophila CBS 207.26]|uniref:FAD/NAD(P)-binding domain-containing protein n=1 Tax=Zopfia rhizophila CBS 207.26 TaxID=1314779 RepID=A0A6A6ESD8_9PEZI|nr:hypothetical protein K469DRAFT_727421 [Zopfia rhizophila CBS 207.26]
MLVIGAGLADRYLLHISRRTGFNVKVVVSSSDPSSIWHLNCYPRARSEHYPGHEKLRRYFGYMDRKRYLKDVEFHKNVVSANWKEGNKMWKIRYNNEFSVHAKFLIAVTGLVSKRYFPSWEVLDSFKGVIHRSSFWPKERIDVAQECARERTPNFACSVRRKKITKEEDEMKKELEGVLRSRLTTQRERLFEELWELRHLVDEKTNDEAINDPREKDILAPLKLPHPLGAKRLSLEQDFYKQFNKPNVDVIDIKSNPVMNIIPKGIRTADGTVHDKGQLLREKRDKGTWMYPGMTTSSFPNFFFLYGPQGPTALSNEPSCVES